MAISSSSSKEPGQAQPAATLETGTTSDPAVVLLAGLQGESLEK